MKEYARDTASRKLSTRWVFDGGPEFFKRGADGTLVKATHKEFQIGDFVDVVAALEIVTLPTKAQVHLTLQSITLLKTQSELQKVSFLHPQTGFRLRFI